MISCNSEYMSGDFGYYTKKGLIMLLCDLAVLLPMPHGLINRRAFKMTSY